MNVLGLVVAFHACLAGAAGVSGHVLDAAGSPVAGSRVFMEQGLAGPVVEAAAGSDGAFAFTEVPPGVAGVFAHAKGRAFGGATVVVRVAEQVTGLTIRLGEPETVSGRVTNVAGKPIAGARLEPAVFHNGAKVGIPLAKLGAFGFGECVSDKSGAFTLRDVPRGATVVLKANHSLHAQEVLQDVAAGASGLRITLTEGVAVDGVVLSRDARVPVARAPIVFRSAQTSASTLTRTDRSGKFLVRMKPGLYGYRAAASEFRSPGWEQLEVSGLQPTQRVTLYVSGAAQIRGAVCDAVSGKPVAGAVVSLAAFGNMVGKTTTGPTGEYQFLGAEGENVVAIMAAPGFQLPELPRMSMNVTQGDVYEVPTFWVTPTPSLTVRVVDAEDNPVPGVVVRLVRPMQVRWHVTGPDGAVELHVASIPASGRIVGMAEHAERPEGALFALEPKRFQEAKVCLFPFSSVTGKVVTVKGKAVEGAVVGALFQAEPTGEPMLLWRTFSGPGGAFRWDAVVPYVPTVCVAATEQGQEARSVPFNLEQGQEKDLGSVVVSDGAKPSSTSHLGKKLPWRESPHLGGPAATGTGRPTVVMFCGQDEAPMVIDAVRAASELVADSGIGFAVVVDGSYSGESACPVLSGTVPGPATTYIVGANGTVLLETAGMPTLRALRRHAAGE
jgi:Carboxypeptidase regulatory-like domain